MERVLSETRLLWSDTVVQYFNLLFLCIDTIMAALSHRGRALFSSSVVDPDDEWDDPNLRSGGDDDDDQPRSFGGGPLASVPFLGARLASFMTPAAAVGAPPPTCCIPSSRLRSKRRRRRRRPRIRK